MMKTQALNQMRGILNSPKYLPSGERLFGVTDIMQSEIHLTFSAA